MGCEYCNHYFNAMQDYRTAILSLGIDLFRDESGTLLDSSKIGARLRFLFEEKDNKIKMLETLNYIKSDKFRSIIKGEL